MGLEKVKKVKLRINAHRGDDEMEFGFPGNWDITECRMTGHDKPALSDDEIRSALQNPVGAPRLSEMAKGAKRVCILFDDIGRPTPTCRIAPFVIEELHAGGVKDDQIRFLSAQGAHRPPIYREVRLKLGREIVEKYPVYIHNAWDNLVDVGKTSWGTPVKVNREFASCDLRLGIGGIVPLGSSIRRGPGNFGGGGKLVLPGVCGIETIAHHHGRADELKDAGDNVGSRRLGIEEAARLAGLHFKVDVVVNNRREVVGLFAGDFVAEHRAGVELANQVYRTETVKDADVVVINSYPDEIQMIKVMWCIDASVRQGGDVVILSHAPDGQMFHQLHGRWGTDFGGRLYDPNRIRKWVLKQEKAERVIVVASEFSKAEKDYVGLEKVLHCRDWAEALGELVVKNGSGTKVVVYPYATVQMPATAG